MNAMLEKIYSEAQRLPEELAQEVYDFICFVEARHGITPQAEGKPAGDWQGFFERHARTLDDPVPVSREDLYAGRLR